LDRERSRRITTNENPILNPHPILALSESERESDFLQLSHSL
jgi:hypothetical protein